MYIGDGVCAKGAWKLIGHLLAHILVPRVTNWFLSLSILPWAFCYLSVCALFAIRHSLSFYENEVCTHLTVSQPLNISVQSKSLF